MKLYSVKINLGGSLINQVRKGQPVEILDDKGNKTGKTKIEGAVTAAEIVLLRAIHGDEHVNDIQHVANVNRSDRAERARLAGMYTRTSPKGTERGAELVRKYLGLDHDKLPDEPPELAAAAPRADDFNIADEEAEVIEPIDVAPIRRARVPRDTAALTG